MLSRPGCLRALEAIALTCALSVTASTAAADSLGSLGARLSPEACGHIAASGREARVRDALGRLERSHLPRPLLEQVLTSPRAAAFLPHALPRLADLADVPGIEHVARRLATGGQSGAYELAVVHAFRDRLSLASGMHHGNEVDGLLRSGTIIESKSGRPKRPGHLLVQLERRASGGERVALALNYTPSPAILQKLQRLSRKVGGRLEVHHIPMDGSGYKVLVDSPQVENPSLPRLDAPRRLAGPRAWRGPTIRPRSWPAPARNPGPTTRYWRGRR